MWDQPFCTSAPPTSLDRCGFFNSAVFRLPFRSISNGSGWWLLYSLAVILTWLCKEARCVYLCHHLDQKSPFNFKSTLGVSLLKSRLWDGKLGKSGDLESSLWLWRHGPRKDCQTVSLLAGEPSDSSTRIDSSVALIYNALVSELPLLKDSESHLALNHPCQYSHSQPGSQH